MTKTTDAMDSMDDIQETESIDTLKGDVYLNSPGVDNITNNWNIKQTLAVASYILTWYILSISLHVYNKWLFSRQFYNFQFPLFVTMMHMILQFSLSALSLAFIFPLLTPVKYPTIWNCLSKLFPCGLATGLDIGLSNSSLKVISLSFYTMVKSAAPVFVVIFAFMFGLEKPTMLMFLTISVISLGVFLMVSTETKEIHFDLLGYFEVQLATIFSGLRWTLTQILLEKQSMGMNNPLATSLFLAPIVAITLFIAFIIVEGLPNLLYSGFFNTISSSLNIIGVIGFGGIVAFLMSIAEFQLIASTNVVTFTIAGIVKEILTIATAAFVFNDKITGDKMLGLSISIVGIFLYNYIRIWHEPKKSALAKKELNHDYNLGLISNK